MGSTCRDWAEVAEPLSRPVYYSVFQRLNLGRRQTISMWVADPIWPHSLCHCTDCQTLSRSAFRTSVRANKEAFNLQGQPKIYVKTAESGAKRAQAFCPECGTSIYSAAVGDSQIFNIRVSTARQRGELRPKSQVWCRSARDWVNDLQSIKQFAKQRNG